MVGKRLLIFLAVVGCFVGVGRIAFPHTANAAGSDEQPLYSAAVPSNQPIPHDALRLRIIANSDSDADQALKRDVRDAIVVTVAKMLSHAQNAEQAKAIVEANLPTLRNVATTVVRDHGAQYSVNTDVGKVPFPTKMYGNHVYPAGDYEALRITIGAGQGQNWWCVLFPPLCFLDIADGDAVPNTGGFPDLPPLETIQVPAADGQPIEVAVRLAAADYGEEIWKSIRHLIGG